MDRLLVSCVDRVSIGMSIEYQSRCRWRVSIESIDVHSTADAFIKHDLLHYQVFRIRKSMDVSSRQDKVAVTTR